MTPDSSARRAAAAAAAAAAVLTLCLLYLDSEYWSAWEHPVSLRTTLSAFATAVLFVLAFTPLLRWIRGDQKPRRPNASRVQAALHVFQKQLESWPKEQAAAAARIVQMVIDGKGQEAERSGLYSKLTVEQFNAVVSFVKALLPND